MNFTDLTAKLPKAYYQDDSVYIINSDCRLVLPLIPDKSVDLCLTDPPYLIHAGYGGGEFGKRHALVNTGDFTDGGVDYSFLLGFQNWFCFCSRLQLPELLNVAKEKERWNVLVWGKTNPLPTINNKYLPDLEFIIHGYSANRLFGGMSVKSNFFLYPCGNKDTDHPNEKPTLLISKLLYLGSQPNDLILDPFLGSGTTAYCAKKLGRKCIGIEIEEKYCEIVAKRCAQSVMNLNTEPEVKYEQPEFVYDDDLPRNP